MSTRAIMALLVAACAPVEEAPDAAFERTDLVEIWHVDDDGITHIIAVPSSAASAHMAHGDWTNPIHVDPAAAPGGNGLPESPLQRLTDAVAVATAMRTAEPDAPITILGAPGDYIGTYSAERLAAKPWLEALPILVDVPGVALIGSSVLGRDDDGLPDGTADTPSVIGLYRATPPETPESFGATQAIVFVSDSQHADGSQWVGDDVTVAGWVLDSAQTTSGAGVGLLSLRVTGLVVADVIANRFGNAVDLRSSDAEVSGVYARPGSSCMVCLHDAAIDLSASRIQDGFVGVFIDSGFAGAVESSGLHSDRTVTPSQAPLHGKTSVRIDDCDLTGFALNKQGSSIRVVALGPGIAPVIQTATIDVEVTGTHFDAASNGVGIDAGFISRDFPWIHSETSVTLRDNTWGTFSQTPLYLTFTRGQPALGQATGHAAYLRGADWSVSLEGSDAALLPAMWIDSPVVDPYGDDTILGNTLHVNGVDVPAPVCQGGWPATTCPL